MTTKPIKIDGKLDEAAWADAPSTGPFVNTMTGAPAEQKTEAKLLWDNKFLYVAFDNTDTDIWSSLTKRDDKLWTQEADEMIIDADGNGKTYVELQVAPNGTIFDTYLPEYRKYEDSVDPEEEALLVELEDERQGARRRHAQQARRQGQGLDRRDGDPARGRARAWTRTRPSCRPAWATSGASTCSAWTCPAGQAAAGVGLVAADGGRLPRARQVRRAGVRRREGQHRDRAGAGQPLRWAGREADRRPARQTSRPR